MTTATRTITFIDSRVADYQTLIAGLAEGTEWFLLDAGKDGIGQMETILSRYTGLDAIQVISHGSQGALYLGSTVLDSGNLSAYRTSLQAIGASLSATGDILLYGCNVAQGDAGIQFIESLAGITGADVAASNDPTGAAALGGDWALEVAAGKVESDPALGDGVVGNFDATLSLLPTFTIDDIAEYVQHGFFDWVGQEYITLPDEYHSFNMKPACLKPRRRLPNSRRSPRAGRCSSTRACPCCPPATPGPMPLMPWFWHRWLPPPACSTCRRCSSPGAPAGVSPTPATPLPYGVCLPVFRLSWRGPPGFWRWQS